jgi:hypothetical protein
MGFPFTNEGEGMSIKWNNHLFAKSFLQTGLYRARPLFVNIEGIDI